MFYFIQNIDDADTGLPLGYESGIVDEFNPSPANSIEVETEDELNKLIAKSEAEDATKLEPNENALPPKTACPIQIPEGIRWQRDEVLFHFSPKLKISDRKWLIEEFELLKAFVEKSCSLKVNITNDVNKAQVKNVAIGELDGRGGTLGETRYSYRGDKMISCTLICDEADQGRGKRTTKKHEYIHCFGIPHNEEDRNSLMWWASDGTVRDYGEYSARELQKRHPRIKK